MCKLIISTNVNPMSLIMFKIKAISLNEIQEVIFNSEIDAKEFIANLKDIYDMRNDLSGTVATFKDIDNGFEMWYNNELISTTKYKIRTMGA